MSQDGQDLQTLEKRLQKVRRDVTPPPPQGARLGQGFNAWNAGMTIVFSLAGGIGVGAILGLGLDRVLGTSPWLLFVMLGFGFAAGIVTAVRMARELESKQPMANDADPSTSNWDDEEEEWLHSPQGGDGPAQN